MKTNFIKLFVLFENGRHLVSKLFSGVIFFLVSTTGFCTVKTANISGNWESASTWNTGTVPGCGDTLMIPASRVVTVTQQDNYTACSSPMTVLINGTLAFITGKKLLFPCGSLLVVQSSGMIDPGSGGGSSNLIDICSTTWWSAAQGPVSGPTCLPDTSPNCSAALPVTLVSFTATWDKRNVPANVNLEWITASEVNNDHFELMRSFNNSNYSSFATVAGHGTTTTIHEYNYSDDPSLEMQTSTIYYLLKQVDYDGRTAYYGPVALKPWHASKKLVLGSNLIYRPNMNSETSLHVWIDGEGVSRLDIIDSYGRMVFSKDLFTTQPVTEMNIELPPMASGFYHLIYQTDVSRDEQKLVVVN